MVSLRWITPYFSLGQWRFFLDYLLIIVTILHLIWLCERLAWVPSLATRLSQSIFYGLNLRWNGFFRSGQHVNSVNWYKSSMWSSISCWLLPPTIHQIKVNLSWFINVRIFLLLTVGDLHLSNWVVIWIRIFSWFLCEILRAFRCRMSNSPHSRDTLTSFLDRWFVFSNLIIFVFVESIKHLAFVFLQSYRWWNTSLPETSLLTKWWLFSCS